MVMVEKKQAINGLKLKTKFLIGKNLKSQKSYSPI